MAQSGHGSVRRRTVLRSLAVGGSVGSVGCMRRLRAATGWQSPRSVSLEIKTFPSDADPYALRIARSVAEGFRTAGLDVTVSPMAPEELFRQVLLQNEFDAFVARTPAGLQNPDALFALLHSRFEAEPGWQNPFGYANLDVDDGLERQRTADGQTRRNVLAAVQRTVARTQPFSVVVFPDDIRAARGDRFVGWNRIGYESPFGYLARDRDPGRAALLAAGGLGAALVLDLGVVGVSAVPVRLVLHRVALLGTLAALAFGVARGDRRTVVRGVAAWVLALAASLLGIL